MDDEQYPNIFLPYAGRPPDRYQGGRWYWDLGEKFQDLPSRIEGMSLEGSTYCLSWGIHTCGGWYFHREDGPAYLEILFDGAIEDKGWFLGGEVATPEEVLEETVSKEEKKSILLWI